MHINATSSLPDALPQGVVPPAQRPSTWFPRNWKWFVPVVVVGLGLCFGVFVLAVLLMVGTMFRSSYPYQFALRQANASDIVAQKIGRPFHVGWFMAGSINLNNSSGEANIEIPISGAKGKGKIFVVAKKREGLWSFQTLDLVVDGETAPISLLNGAPTGSPPDSRGATAPIAMRLHPVN